MGQGPMDLQMRDTTICICAYGRPILQAPALDMSCCAELHNITAHIKVVQGQPL